MRLNVSGSAACPVEVFEEWRDLTGQMLLERYGMTEIGMALSNPYRGERRPGYVGQVLPDVAVRLVDEEGGIVTEEGTPGRFASKSDRFLEYWGNAEATEASFAEGWFCTGDIAVIEDGSYRIMGRSSVDIIKSGATNCRPSKLKTNCSRIRRSPKWRLWGSRTALGRGRRRGGGP